MYVCTHDLLRDDAPATAAWHLASSGIIWHPARGTRNVSPRTRPSSHGRGRRPRPQGQPWNNSEVGPQGCGAWSARHVLPKKRRRNVDERPLHASPTGSSDHERRTTKSSLAALARRRNCNHKLYTEKAYKENE